MHHVGQSIKYQCMPPVTSCPLISNSPAEIDRTVPSPASIKPGALVVDSMYRCHMACHGPSHWLRRRDGGLQDMPSSSSSAAATHSQALAIHYCSIVARATNQHLSHKREQLALSQNSRCVAGSLGGH